METSSIIIFRSSSRC